MSKTAITTHLHVHSQYTLLGGAASVADLTARAASDGMSRLALTDTNALYGAVAFTRACHAAGIQPILGMAVTVAWPADLQLPDTCEAPSLLVLLANGPAGYRSLCCLSSLLQGHADRAARLARGLDWDDLRAHRDGLLCLSGGRRGWIERCLRAGDVQTARRLAGRLAGIYEEQTYLSLELHTADDIPVAEEIIATGQFLGIPPVAVQPVYCLAPEDAPRLRLLAAIDHNCRLEAVPVTALPDNGDSRIDLHWLSPAELTARFAAFPDALARTVEITQDCAPALPTGTPLWPRLDLPDGQTPAEALITQANAGLTARYGPTPDPVIQTRLARELDVINRYGYAPLFLIVADIVRHARARDIPVSTRGSVANALVAYCLGITTVDPIAHDLLFERFLSPARADLPDIDLDFCSRRRDEVLAYVRRTYGEEHVALVATISTLQLRSAVREVAKAYGLNEMQLQPLLKNLPHGWHPRHRESRTLDDLLKPFSDSQQREVLRAAYEIVGQPHHLSVHPGGVVITPGPLTDILPVQWSPKGFVITQFDHLDVEALGLPKLDLLGIRALTVLADAAGLVRRDHDPAFQLTAIPLDDAATGALLARGDTVGVFQCESEGARRTLRKLNARTVRDLAVANAFFKPGPATGGLADAFVQRYRGDAPVQYLHPALEPILAPTMGVLLFQEQILRVAVEVAGLSWEQAGYLRRGMSKMDAAEMAPLQQAFELGCRRPPPDGPGFTTQQAQQLWEQVAVFSGYGFNQGHATAYADVSYRSAYLKAHYPAAFLAARLQDWGGYHHPAMYMAEAIRLGMAVRPPHVNHSAAGFTLAWEDAQAVLWMGLGHVRDLRQQTIREIIAARQTQPFVGIGDVLTRLALQDKEIDHLIRCGAMDGLGERRAAMLAAAALTRRAGSAQQMAFAFAQPPAQPETVAQQWAWEKRLLGYPLHALQAWLPQLAAQFPTATTLSHLLTGPGQPGVVAGARLPGWGRGGFYVWDGIAWALAKCVTGLATPPPWEPVILHGRGLHDTWGMEWLQIEQVERPMTP
ncbi:MAG: DNA polymerase III subunit alpha [Anaerolineae bacterium]